ncbi:hypothetical protein ACLI1A_16945 [Flavobacterium sp. RHBU_3]|uniref:hypothetical protein n=1 Tax=Flavobacterium sp. RHBU_3 TaxID=3391184 RepID=UPI00398514EF
MKTLFLFFSVVLLTHNISIKDFDNQEKNVSPVEFLKEFYIAYNAAWSQGGESSVLIGKLKQLQAKYCSKEFQKVLNNNFEESGLDYDILISNYYANKNEIKTLNITSLKGKGKYLVSYKVTINDFGTKKVETIKIKVTLIQENGKLKINDVE